MKSTSGEKPNSSDLTQSSVTKEITFKTRVSGTKPPLSMEQTIGDAIEMLLALTRSDLPYIKPEMLKVMPALLMNFRDFQFTRSEYVKGIRKEREIKVASAPLSALEYAIMEWINGFINLDDYFLLPTYAIASAKFISAHLFGYINLNDEHGWQIEGMLDSTHGDIHFIHDPQFKRRITNQIGNTVALAKVPKKSAIVLESKKVIMEPGADFLFRIQRCHLSSGFHDFSYFSTNQPETNFDLFNDFKFRGGIMFKPSKRTKDIPEEFDVQQLEGEIPITWISHIRLNMITKENQEALPSWITNS